MTLRAGAWPLVAVLALGGCVVPSPPEPTDDPGQGDCAPGYEWDGAYCLRSRDCPVGYFWDGLGCSPDEYADDPTSTARPTTSSTASTTTGSSGPYGAVAGLMNGPDSAHYAAHWSINEGAGMAGNYAFFSDGTGVWNYYGASGQGTAITWSQPGSATLLIDQKHIFSTAAQISGGTSDGMWSAVLDGNPTRRTFSLASGTL